jgi:hypothetical protein
MALYTTNASVNADYPKPEFRYLHETNVYYIA